MASEDVSNHCNVHTRHIYSTILLEVAITTSKMHKCHERVNDSESRQICTKQSSPHHLHCKVKQAEYRISVTFVQIINSITRFCLIAPIYVTYLWFTVYDLPLLSGFHAVVTQHCTTSLLTVDTCMVQFAWNGTDVYQPLFEL